jgi:hypothetical protein
MMVDRLSPIDRNLKPPQPVKQNSQTAVRRRRLRVGPCKSPAREPTSTRMLAIQDRFVSCCGLVESLTFEAYELCCFGTEIEKALGADP